MTQDLEKKTKKLPVGPSQVTEITTAAERKGGKKAKKEFQ